MEAAEIAKLISNYGVGIVCLAVLISLHVYNVRVTIPKASEMAQKAIDDMVRAEREDRNRLVDAFRSELALERQMCHNDHEKIFDMMRVNQEALVRISERLKII